MTRSEPGWQRRTMNLLGESIDFRANARALWRTHRPYLVLLGITMILDVLSTIAFMSVLGPGAEHNPVVRLTSYSFGVILGPPIGKLFQLFGTVGLSILTPRLARFILSVVILMNLFAFVVNMHVFVLA